MTIHPQNRIKDARVARGITQEALADALDTSSAQIHKLENGKVTLSLAWMLRIAEVLRCPPSDLLPAMGDHAAIREALAEKAAILKRLIADGHLKAASELASDLAKAIKDADQNTA